MNGIANWLRGITGGALVRGLLAYASGEVACRVARIIAVVVIARRVSPETMGAAAIALSLFEIIRVLANIGIGQRIIAASDYDLARVCNGADWLFRRWCLGIAALQCVVAGILALSGLREPACLLAVLALVYPLMPPGLVRVYLLMRSGRMATTARIGATQTITDHFLTMLLVVIAPSAWALVLPKLLTTPLWLVLVRRAQDWRPQPAAGTIGASYFLRFGAGVMGSEIASVARSQCDNLLVGTLLGMHALGLYYFSFGAGLGLTGSFATAVQTVVFAHLARQNDADRRARFRQAALTSAVMFIPVVSAQILLAPIYVPLVFGAKWAEAVPFVATLGLAALPLLLGSATTAFMRAERRPLIDACVNAGATAAALIGLSLGSATGLAGATAGYVAGLATVLIPYFCIQALARPQTLTLANEGA